jgi:hypothetical protein
VEQTAPPSQKFPDELKRNREKRTRGTARWILMVLERLAGPDVSKIRWMLAKFKLN